VGIGDWYQLFCSNVIYNNLKDHLVRSVVLSKRELGSKVVLHQGSGIHSLQDGSINLLLVSLALITDNGGLGLIIGKELLLSLGTVRSNTGKVGIVNLGNIGSRDINLSGGTDHISLVDPAKRNAIDLVRSSHKEETRLKSLKANDTLSTETSSEEDAHSSGGEGGTDLGCIVLLGTGVLRPGDVIGGVISGGLASGGGSLGGLLRSGSSEYAL
jgi:hypothetical protein